MKRFFNYVPLASVLLVGSLEASAASIALSGSDATGYTSLTGVNNEFGETYTGTGKGFEYPYYWNPDKGYWEVIVAEGLSADSSYAQESQYSVQGKTVTDADFSQFNVGSITYSDSLITGVGTETIGIADLTLAIDASDFNPMGTARNVSNEFAWTYDITASGLTGSGLTFVNGELTDINLQADLAIDVKFLGSIKLNWDTPSTSLVQAASFNISGDQLSFSLDQIASAPVTPVGSVTDARLILNRAGTIDAVRAVPVPAAAWLFLSSLTGLAVVGRRRNKK